LFLTLAVFFGLLVFSAISAYCATIITFDDLHETASGSFIANGYQGLSWSNFAAKNAILLTDTFGVSGYYYGMVSPSNVAYGAFSGGAEIDSATNLDFLSAYFTGAWNSNLNIEVQGYRGRTNLIYDETLVVSATNATLFTFDYLDIDRLTFTPSGGQNAGFFLAGGVNFVMDNFMFEFIPEPSTFLLAALAAVSLAAVLRRQRG